MHSNTDIICFLEFEEDLDVAVRTIREAREDLDAIVSVCILVKLYCTFR